MRDSWLGSGKAKVLALNGPDVEVCIARGGVPLVFRVGVAVDC